MIRIYGIPNCDTIKKTLDWMKQHEVSFTFQDYRKEPIEKKLIQQWSQQVSLQVLLNKKSTTWKELTPAEQQAAEKKAGAIALLSKHPTLMKRPVIVKADSVIAVGFNAEVLAALFSKK